MKTKDMTIVRLWKQHVRGTAEKAIIKNVTILACLLTKAVQEACKLNTPKVHLNTRVVKHLWDKKPAEEFDCIIKNLQYILRYPNAVYRNKDTKRGDLCFVKELSNIKYLCSIEITEELDNTNNKMTCVVTAFRVRKASYLDNYELIWSWKGDNPSS